MKILVTGAHGFIGGWVCRELESRDIQAVPFDRPNHDIMDNVDVREAVFHADGVINLAGTLGTAELIGSEYAAVKANILGALNVFDVCEDQGIPLVQIGTGHKGQPNPYAITKGCAEDLALSRARWKGQQITVVRAYHVYGPGQKAAWPYGHSTVRKIAPSFICAALRGDPLEVNGSGRQEIDLVWVGDVAKVLVDALYGPQGGVVEAGTGKSTTVSEAAQDVLAACESASFVHYQPMRLGEPEDTTVVAQDPVCPNPWPYRLEETIDYYRAQL